MTFLVTFILGFLYGYSKKRRNVQGFGWVGYAFCCIYILGAFFILQPDDAYSVGYVGGVAVIPVLIFVLGNFAGRRMDIL